MTVLILSPWRNTSRNTKIQTIRLANLDNSEVIFYYHQLYSKSLKSRSPYYACGMVNNCGVSIGGIDEYLGRCPLGQSLSAL